MKAVFVEQFKTNGVNLIIPFKLGEAYRFLRFKKVFNSGFTSLNTLIIERFFDFTILAFLFSVGLYIYPGEVPEIQNTMVSIMLVLMLILVTILSLEDTVLIIHKRLLYRSENRWSYPLLKFSHEFLMNLREAKKVLKAKSLSILSFTILIWSFELLSLFIFFGELSYRIDLLHLADSFYRIFFPVAKRASRVWWRTTIVLYDLSCCTRRFNNYLIASTAYTVYIFGTGISDLFVLFILNFIKKGK